MKKLTLFIIIIIGLLIILHKNVISRFINHSEINFINNFKKLPNPVVISKYCCTDCPEPGQWGHEWCSKNCDNGC